MSEQTKRILAIVGFIVSVLVIGTALYFVFFRGATPIGPDDPTDQVTDTPDIGSLPSGDDAGDRVFIDPTPPSELEPADTIARGDITETTSLTSGVVASPGGNGDGVNFFDPNQGQFFSVDEDGNINSLTEDRFLGAENIIWDEDAEAAVIEFPDGSNVVYDFETDTQVTLPSHWEDFEFNNAREEIVAKSLGNDVDNRWLVTVNKDGTNAKAIAALGENESRVTVAPSNNNQVVAFSDTADPIGGGFNRRMILPIGKNEENFPGLIVEGISFIPNWSPSGKQLLYSTVATTSQNRPTLWAVDATASTMGENRRNLGLNTWADKCSFSTGTTLYCAVPQNLPPNYGLQRSLASNLPDNVYRVDLSSGNSTLIAIPENDTTMTNLSVSSDGSSLFYTNTRSGQIETIQLK